MHPELWTAALRDRHGGLADRVVCGRVGRGLGPLAGRQALDPVDQGPHVVGHRQAGAEHIVVLLVALGVLEDTVGVARALDHGEVVAAHGLGGRRGEQRRERAERQVDVVLHDQLLVLGLGLVRVAVVVEDLELDLAAEQSAVAVDVALPELVALLERLAVGGEAARQRERDAHQDVRVRAVLGGGRATAASQRGRRDRGGRAECEKPGRMKSHPGLLLPRSRIFTRSKADSHAARRLNGTVRENRRSRYKTASQWLTILHLWVDKSGRWETWRVP